MQKPSNPKDAVGATKAPFSTVSMPAVSEAGLAMLEGALKYGRHNYRAVGVRSSVYFDAAMRHLCAWWEGEDIDEDSGLPHITKAIASLLVLRDAQMQGLEFDDRPPTANAWYRRHNDRAAQMIESYPDDPKPPHIRKEEE